MNMDDASCITIEGRRIGPGSPVYIVAELSANHHQEFETAARLIQAAHRAGADAVKLQTLTPDGITIDCKKEPFKIGRGTAWEGYYLYDLYKETQMPWEWQPKLKKIANELGMHLFSSPFDHSAVDFLREMGVPCYKIASFELVDIPLIEKMAAAGKPLLMSTGMADEMEIEEAVSAARGAGCEQIALLKCTSAYPAPIDELNLKTIPYLAKRFNLAVGLSDHSMEIIPVVAAVVLGACIVEKHLTLSRKTPGPDSGFSLEPDEFSQMVRSIRLTERALGDIRFNVGIQESHSIQFRRSLFAVEDIREGEALSIRNIRSIRPGHGLPPKYMKNILGRRVNRAVERGTPLSWNLIEGEPS